MVRTGDWKLIVFGQEGMPVDFKPLLFNVKADPFELVDLSDRHGEV